MNNTRRVATLSSLAVALCIAMAPASAMRSASATQAKEGRPAAKAKRGRPAAKAKRTRAGQPAARRRAAAGLAKGRKAGAPRQFRGFISGWDPASGQGWVRVGKRDIPFDLRTIEELNPIGYVDLFVRRKVAVTVKGGRVRTMTAFARTDVYVPPTPRTH